MFSAGVKGAEAAAKDARFGSHFHLDVEIPQQRTGANWAIQPRHFSTLRISLIMLINPSIESHIGFPVPLSIISLPTSSDFKSLAILLEDSYSSFLTSIPSVLHNGAPRPACPGVKSPKLPQRPARRPNSHHHRQRARHWCRMRPAVRQRGR